MAATAPGGVGVPPPDYYAPNAPPVGSGKMGLSQQVTFAMQGPQQSGKSGSMGLVTLCHLVHLNVVCVY